MKVLFLDIDGVIKDKNYCNYESRHFQEYLKNSFLLKDKFKILAEICKKYDLKVVVSSSWKCQSSYGNYKCIEDVESNNNGLQQLHALLNKYGIELYGYTPDVPNPGVIWCQNMCKEFDITAFLIEHPEITDYVIVDDVFENDIYTLNNHLLKTSFDEDGLGNGGLLPHHVDDIKDYIKPREVVVPEKMNDNLLYKQIKESEFELQDCGSFGLMKVFDEVTLHISLSFDYTTVFFHWYGEYDYNRGVIHNYEEFLDLLAFLGVVKKEIDEKTLMRRC